MNFYKSIIKPFLDRLVSFFLLLFLFPLLISISFLLYIHFRGNPFYLQKRVGVGGKIFKIIKFRSYREEGVESSVTKIGQIIRKYSIDEWPQLINILKGEMSFVGPRPLFIEYQEYYDDEQSKRQDVMPGFTGLSQLEMGNSDKWVERLQLDVTYVENQSLKIDFMILLRTLLFIFSKRRKVNTSNHLIRFDEFVNLNG